MKTRNVLVVIGLILILINMLYYFSGSFKLPQGDTNYRVGYIIGSSLFGIIGLVLLLIGYFRHRNITRKKEKEMMDSFLK